MKDTLTQLQPVMGMKLDDYQGHYSKSKRNGQGMIRMSNGDTYRGNFKED